MKFARNIRDLAVWVLLGLAVVSFAAAFAIPRSPGDSRQAAARVSRTIAHRMDFLEQQMDKALNQNPYEWMALPGLPSDMVVYRYCKDTLQSWAHQFPIFNDELVTGVMFRRFSNPRARMESPLSAVSDTVSFVNLGSKWYLLKSMSVDDCRVIGGLEIADSDDGRSYNGVNPRLNLRERFVINPLSYDEGSAVSVGGIPQFKIFYDSLVGNASAQPSLMWMALALMLACGIIFLTNRKTLRRFIITSSGILIVTAIMYFWGRTAQNDVRLFSPMLFAGGSVLYSLGAVILINLAITLLALSLYLVRHDLFHRVKSKPALWCNLIATIIAVALILLYTHLSISSIVRNSGITLELYKFSDFSKYSALVYASFIVMLLSIPLLLQLLRPAFLRLFGFDFDALARGSRVLFATAIAVYLTLITGVHGFEMESSRLEVLANRLSIDRDISLELRLKMMENQIAEDPIIKSLSIFPNTSTTIQNRIGDFYLARIDRNYIVSAMVLNNHTRDPRARDLFNSRIRGGEPIADNSHFLYVNRPGGSYYAGVFTYFVDAQGYGTVLVTIEGRSGQGINGYAKIMGASSPGAVFIPAGYSYARYDDHDLQYYTGNFAYPTKLSESLHKLIYSGDTQHMRADGHTHFIFNITPQESVVVSRPSTSPFNYVISCIFIGLVAFIVLSVLTLGHKPKKAPFMRSYYKSRISAVLMVSLILTLVAMAAVSVLFVYDRNESNLKTIMSDKMNSIISMMENSTRMARTPQDVTTPDMITLLETVSENSGSDITLFGPRGRMLATTSPMFFEGSSLASRMDGDAYDNIINQHKRYYIHKESIGQTRFYSMYAPLRNIDGDIVAILCSPYNGDTYDFEEDAVTHSMAIVSVFLFLLLLARFMTNEVLSRLFRPLSELGHRIDSTNLDSLETIEYDRDDEVKSLVTAYNRMVGELSESTRKLAQAERDKAWSGMARQVAHEIKNPLTPMKLQLQRVIRLKQKNDPEWQNRFDEASKVLLDHIDILTDTANEFSTFAKLYSEEPTEINLDTMLQEEISMFDNREDVKFDYLGLSDALVCGPKPQLTRVFVNLLSNSVQAVEEQGGGRVVVMLRNSSRDGFYEVVVEDDGPGVSSENVDKLFTPNFTTKNSGSGLGLAISRSILERCGASISYSRSFTLGGACFTVLYPKQTHYD